jgi:hypothetical protein
VLQREAEVRRSAEIEAVASRLLRGIEGCEADLVADLLSQQTGARIIGSDPEEWHSGYKQFGRSWLPS